MEKRSDNYSTSVVPTGALNRGLDRPRENLVRVVLAHRSDGRRLKPRAKRVREHDVPCAAHGHILPERLHGQVEAGGDGKHDGRELFLELRDRAMHVNTLVHTLQSGTKNRDAPVLSDTVVHDRRYLLRQRVHFHAALHEVDRLRRAQDRLEPREFVQERIAELHECVIVVDGVVRELPQFGRVFGAIRGCALRGVVGAAAADKGSLVRLSLDSDD